MFQNVSFPSTFNSSLGVELDQPRSLVDKIIVAIRKHLLTKKSMQILSSLSKIPAPFPQSTTEMI